MEDPSRLLSLFCFLRPFEVESIFFCHSGGSILHIVPWSMIIVSSEDLTLTFPHEHHYLLEDREIVANARKSTRVFALTAFMMVVEIVAGYFTHSMALLADGWHMASHAAAMVIALIAYRLGQSRRISESLSFGAGKLIPLGGFSSALILAMISVLMATESIARLFSPQVIHFNEAIGIAVLGLGVNLASAWILEGGLHHHEEEHEHDHDEEEDHHHHDHSHDHNLRSAYVHVLADALTSIFAIIALSAGKFFGLGWMDPVMGIVSSLVILKWAYALCRDTGSELLDVHSRRLPPERVRKILEGRGIEVLDLHTWRVAPNAIACELVVLSSELRGGDFYRELVKEHFEFGHLIVEERVGK